MGTFTVDELKELGHLYHGIGVLAGTVASKYPNFYGSSDYVNLSIPANLKNTERTADKGLKLLSTYSECFFIDDEEMNKLLYAVTQLATKYKHNRKLHPSFSIEFNAGFFGVLTNNNKEERKNG